VRNGRYYLVAIYMKRELYIGKKKRTYVGDVPEYRMPSLMAEC
jgi:hypothetical protein